MDKPNFLFLTIDTLRADTLGYMGYKRPITPQIDRLAAQGVRFTQAITPGSWTQAAFPGMLTATYASMYGGCLGPLSPARPSPIGELTRQKGYRTAAFSTSPLLSKTYGYDQNIQHFVDLQPGEKDPKIRFMKGGQRLLRSSFFHRLVQLTGQNWRPPKIYSTAAELNETAMKWLQETDEPFFAWLHYMDVHWPYHIEEELKAPGEVAAAWTDLAHLYEVNWRGVPVSEAQKERYIRLYEEAIQYCDAQIGRLLEFLEQSGLAENTVVVLVSDHGEEFLERRHWGHVELNLYDEILKVPLIIRVPGVAGQSVARQVSTIDLMPTLLDLAGCELPTELLGESMAPLWRGEEGRYGRQIAIGERWRDTSHMIAVRTEQFKYIWDDAQSDEGELYHLAEDPGERHNVWAQHPEVVSDLHHYVQVQLERMRETMPAEQGAEPDLDDEIIARLRGLGYVE